MKTKTKTKNLKPIDIDAHFKYKCPDSNCGFDHWLSLKECQTKGFKIVCDCGLIFKPKRINSININYSKEQISKPTKQIEPEQTSIQQLPFETQNAAVELLVGYGFTESESESLCKKGFMNNPVNNAGSLVKYIIQNLGELNEQNQ